MAHGKITATLYNHGNLSTAVATSTAVTKAEQRYLPDGKISRGRIVISAKESTFLDAVKPGMVIRATMTDDQAGGSVVVALFEVVDAGIRYDKDPKRFVSIEGPDMYNSLGRIMIQSDTFDDGAGGQTLDAVEQAIAHASGWTVNYVDGVQGQTSQKTYLEIKEMSVLDALKAIAKQCGDHFYLDPAVDRQIRWQEEVANKTDATSSAAESALYLKGGTYTGGTYDPILSFSVQGKRRGNGASRLYVYGAGSGENRFTFEQAFSGGSPKAGVDLKGMTAYPASSLLVNDAMETAGYPVTERVLQLGDIEPSDADNSANVEAAAISLVNAAAIYLAEIEDWATGNVTETFIVTTEYHERDGFVLQPLSYTQAFQYADWQEDYNLETIIAEFRHTAEGGKRTTEIKLVETWRSQSNPMAAMTDILEDYRATKRRGDTAGGAAPAESVTDHGNLANLNDETHHPWALTTTGGRTLTGNMPVAAGVTIDGIDLSGHATNEDAHHAAFVGLEDNAGAAISPAADNRIRVTDDNVINADANGNTLALSIDQSLLAGDGLLVSGNALDINLGSPSGLVIVSDALAVSDAIAGDGLDIASKVLAVDVTEIIDTAYGLTEASNNIQINLASPAGLAFYTGALAVDDNIAGDGLTITSKVLAVGVSGLGLSTTPNAVILTSSSSPGAAASILASDTNGYLQLERLGLGASPGYRLDVTGNGRIQSGGHLYFRDTALSIHSSANGQLDIDADTKLEMVAPAIELSATSRVHVSGGPLDLAGTLEFQGAQSITTTSGDLTIAAGGKTQIHTDLMLDNNSRIYESYASGYFGGGYALEYDGARSFLEIDDVTIRGTLRTHIFQYDVVRATNGYLYISDASEIARPADDVNNYIYVREAVFQIGDLLWYKDYDLAGGSIYSVEMEVTAGPTAVSENGQTYQRYTVTVNSGLLTNLEVAGTVVRVGSTSDTTREGSLYLDASSTYAPFIDVIDDVSSWATFGGSAKTKARLGQLEGITSTDEYGLFAGTGTADTDQYIVASGQGLDLQNVDITINDGSNDVISLTHTGGIKVSNGAWGTDTSVFAAVIADDATVTDLDANDVLIGTYFHSTTDNQKGIHWDDSQGQLKIKGDLVVGAGTGFILNDAAMVCHYDGDPRDFSGTLIGHRGQAPTNAPEITFLDGKFGKAIQTAEAGTNYILNPTDGFGNWTWHTPDGAPTRTNDTQHTKFEDRSYKVIVGAGERAYTHPWLNAGSTDVSVPNGDTIRWSGWVRRALAGGNFWLGIYDATNSVYRDSVSFTDDPDFPVGEWKRYTSAWTNNTGSAVNVRLYVWFNHLTEPDDNIYWLDGFQATVTTAGYDVPLIVGSMPDCTWSGTAYGSHSTRTGSKVEYDNPVDITGEGSVACWIYREDWSETFAAIRGVFDLRADGNNTVRALTNHSDNLVIAYVGDSTSVAHIVSPATLSAGWHHIAITWSSNEIAIYLDGVQEAVDSTPSLATSNPITLRVGSLAYNTLPWNGRIDELVTSDRALTAEEIEAIYESNAPVTVGSNNHELMLAGGPDKGTIVAHAGGIYATDAAGNETFAFVNEDVVAWDGVTYNTGDIVFGRNVSGSSQIVWDASTGKWGFYGDGNGTVQVEIDTDGSLLAGGGNVWMNNDGLRLEAITSKFGSATIEWYDGSTREFAIGTESDLSNVTACFVQSDSSLTLESVSGSIYMFSDVVVQGSDLTVDNDVYASKGLSVGDATMNPENDSVLIANAASRPSAPSGATVLYSWLGELNVIDSSGNTTVLSPHNFSLIPDGPSEPLAWSFYSERDGKAINVDMLKLARLLEDLTGEKLVYIEPTVA